MATTIGSNISSLRAQRSLGQTSSTLSQIFERLSSGQRINKASDDAAGLSVESKLYADRRVYTQGIRNLNDGASALNIAEGSIDSLGNIVIRLKELAEQSANGVYSAKQRKSLDAEAQALSDEYFRISKSAKFNGINLFDGTLGELRLQAGYGTDGGVASGVGGAIGTGSFGASTSFAAGSDPYCITFGDLNGDGALDMVTADFGAACASVFLGNGDGTFGAMVSYSVGTQPCSVVLGDLNGDGILDMVTANKSAKQANVLLGLGDGTFGARTPYTTYNSAPMSVVLGDLNGDHVLDMMTACYGKEDEDDGAVEVRLGNGDGTFGSRGTFWVGGQVNAAALGDIDGDGILDAVTVGIYDSTKSRASILIGNNDGTFRGATYINLGSGADPRSVVLADLNNDSMLDMVTAKYGHDKAYTSLAKGDGSFQGVGSFSTGDGPSALAVGDLNGDGILDMVTADKSAGGISVLLGNGDGTFCARTSVSTGASPTFTALGDLNGDGVLDVTTADSGPDNASVFLAQTKSGVSPLLPFDLSTMADAKQAMGIFDNKLNQLTAQKGQLGAFQSRLAVATSVLSSSTENIAAASGRIMDADVAEESSRLVRAEILQQAGSAILAQANQQPALALTLLQG